MYIDLTQIKTKLLTEEFYNKWNKVIKNIEYYNKKEDYIGLVYETITNKKLDKPNIDNIKFTHYPDKLKYSKYIDFEIVGIDSIRLKLNDLNLEQAVQVQRLYESFNITN